MVVPAIEVEQPPFEIGFGARFGIGFNGLLEGVAGFVLIAMFIPGCVADPAELVRAVTAVYAVASTILFDGLMTFRTLARVSLQPFRRPSIIASITEPRGNGLADGRSMIVIYTAAKAECMFLVHGTVDDRYADGK